MRTILTSETERIESGAVQFTHQLNPPKSDWPGVFLRGDHCAALYGSLQKVIDHYRQTGPGSALVKRIDVSYIDELMQYIHEANPRIRAVDAPTQPSDT